MVSDEMNDVENFSVRNRNKSPICL